MKAFYRNSLLHRRLALLFLGGAVFLQAGCKTQPAAPPAPPKVTVSHPVVQEIIEWDEYTGRLEATENVEVRARVNGYLQSIHFKDGAIVKKGDLLFVIDPRPYLAELDRDEKKLDHMSESEHETLIKDFFAYLEVLRKDRLKSLPGSRRTKNLHRRSRKRCITDGPYAETKE